ncbi:MAG: hemolysin [Microcystis aeruginosa G11-01]|nr:hemolysin [Microcystis aeruginosa LL11-07]NCR89285.1 hemolysin [Microcystis aeruginosa G13-10]NCS34620.1 hemolysin [Microcystis aeruginosa G11-01]
MTNLLQTTLNKTYNQLKNFAGLNDFWNLFEIAFGTQYDHTVATNLRSQWLVGDFSSFPQIEILDSSILGNASGAYGTSTNKIYLAANFLDTATDTDIIAVLLEEYGHFVDAHINQTDSAGDEGDIFSNLVRGNILSAGTLQALKGENDWATITVGGQSIEVEQATMFLSDLNFTASAGGPFKVRDLFDAFYYENVQTINPGVFRARFKNVILPSGPNLAYNQIGSFVPGSPPTTGLTTTITPLDSTVKGLLIHTATSTIGGPTSAIWTPPSSMPPYSNTTTATNFLSPLPFTTISRHLFAEDTFVGAPLNVGRMSRSSPMTTSKVTLVWTGTPSTTDSDPMLNLSLVPTSPSGATITPVTIGINSFVGTENTTGWTGEVFTGAGAFEYVQQIEIPTTYLPFSSSYDVFVGGSLGSSASQDFSIFFTSNPVVGQGHGWGDVHLVNFDGKPYDFQAVGEFILVKSLIDDFQVQTRQKPWGASTTVSVNTAFATTIDGYNVVYDSELAVGQELKIDGVTYNLASGQSVFLGSSKIQRSGNNYTFTYAGLDGDISTTDDNDVVIASDNGSYIDVYVDPADYRFGVLQGLLGNGDGVSTNDFALRNGIDLGPNPTDQTIHTTYADSWRITQQESLFGTETFADKKFPDNYVSLNTLAEKNPQGVANAFATARKFGIAEGAFSKGAAFDFLVTGDETFLLGAKQAANLALQNGNPKTPLGSIKGSKWNDANANGIWDKGEEALAGWTIYIDSVTNGKLDPWEISTVTNADGQYTFSNLGPGEYAIREVNQTGWIQTSPTTPYALNLKAGEKLTGINFGNYFQLPKINLSPNSQTIVEGLTSPQNVAYTVTLSSVSTVPVSVNIATANGTATAGLDYTAINVSLTFAPGVTSQVINIPILNDSLSEADETFTLTLSSPTNATLGTTTTVTTAITDTLTAGVTTVLPANVENLTLTGAAAINGTGNAGNNVITGNTGNNILNGGAGVDTLIGGLGNDTYIVDTATDTITELAGGGTDTIQSSVTYTIAALNNVENLTLTGAAAINGTGNAGNNVITGNTANNLLNGGGGNDTLNGGLGVDSLTGGVGNDFFWLDNVANRDLITDFSVPADTIILANSLDSTLTGFINPGIKGLSFISGNVNGSVLSAGQFFKGAGLTGGALGNLSGIYVNTSNGDIWYNDSTVLGSYLIANVVASAAAGMTNADFVYGV